MANITAAEVNNLRKITGAGMMDCKAALIESNGDTEKAIDILRKKGQKVANKRADKEANEGIVLAKTSTDGKFGVIIKLSCETDFVAKNDDFVAYANAVIDEALKAKPASLEQLNNMKVNGLTVQVGVTDLVGKTGEKMELASYEFIHAGKVFAYNHMGNKLATLVGMNKDTGSDEGHQVAMQVAAMSPVALDKESVSQDIIDKEIEIGKDIARQEGKPEEMLEKIAMGKLNKFFKENTLMNQDFIRDSKITVAQFLKNADADLKITEFKRVMLGS